MSVVDNFVGTSHCLRIILYAAHQLNIVNQSHHLLTSIEQFRINTPHHLLTKRKKVHRPSVFVTITSQYLSVSCHIARM